MAEPIIKFDKLNKWYGNSFHVLRDIDLNVAQGERIVICGPSGSGKSTLIRCINRLEEHQQGHLFVEEALVGPAAMESFLERRDEFAPPPTAVDAGEAGLDAVGGRVGEYGFVKPLSRKFGPESAGGAAAGGLCGKSVRRAKGVKFGVKVFRTHAERICGGDQVVTVAEFLAEGGMVGSRQMVAKEGMTPPVVVGGQAMLWPIIGVRTGAEAGGQFTLE